MKKYIAQILVIKNDRLQKVYITTTNIFILFVFISIVYSCNSSGSNNKKLVTEEKVFSISRADEIETKEFYTKIVQVIKKNDTIFLAADYVQYLTGDKAIETAKKYNQADTFKKVDGTTHIGIPNDYLVLNENKKIRQLPLTKDCIFELIINDNGKIRQLADCSLTDLLKDNNEGLFVLTINEEGFVIKVKEVFLP